MFRRIANQCRKIPTVYLHNNTSLPIYSCRDTQLTTKEIVNILLDPTKETSHVCYTPPTCVEVNNYCLTLDCRCHNASSVSNCYNIIIHVHVCTINNR